MREIKFRAWDKIRKEMINIDVFSQKYFLEKSNNFTRPLKEVELMQYTGLKDKNGIEIYEGDIIQGINRQDKPETVTEEIYWAKDKCAFTPLHYPSLFKFELDKSTIEVIGNIHENPELLEGETK